jgi:hypothetical protein
MYMIVAQNMSISSSSIFQARFYLGGSLQTSSLYGYVAGVQDTTWTVSAWQNGTDDRTRIADTGYMDTGADYNFVMYLPNVNNTTYPHGYWGSGVRLRNARPTQYFFSGLYNSTGSALTGVRFYMNAGTISGTFRLYGLKNN